MLVNRDITIHQLETQVFYQVPQLFTRTIERKWDSVKKQLIEIHYTSPYVVMSSDAKLAYGIFLNRCQLSIYSYQQGNRDYIDENDAVFMIYTVQDLMKALDKSKNTVIKIKKELTQLGLLREVRQGKNQPNRLYLQNVDATCQIIEHYDENDVLLKQFDYFGKLLYEREELSTEEVKSLDISGSSKNALPKGGSNFELPEAQNLSPSNTNISETENNNISSRKAEKNSEEFSQPAGADDTSLEKNIEKYIPPKYYSLLQVIADEYNGKFCQQDLFTGEFQNYSLTHKQKMMIGQYLSEGYVTSHEVIKLIERIPYDCESPLAYLMRSLENLKEERRLEAKIVAHKQAELIYGKPKEESDDGEKD
ncbi:MULTISPECIES: replication initiator protein A [Streptococcus]|uniref:replication initiator protein A n=1 Tax=Streptococcus TaxID=1301 RepID=UPI0010ECA0E9|nr:replication initiator protein A [Streptococcus dysgalactiae]VTS27426.1 putative replication initiation protein Rep [Streptococcus dysgalactiae subsp. equisimilis]VTS37483.1 putative replication initiation protein Rep [Streptococcus dysgalactiae subsp. equisimilis]